MSQSIDVITGIGKAIWEQKYRLKDDAGVAIDRTVGDTFARVATAAAQAEQETHRSLWRERFLAAMSDFEFLPAGRILAGAGSGRGVTLFNCFVMGRIEDDLGSIFDNVKQAALTMQQGGGIGHDFSTLRPRGAPVRSIGADASGPVSFMDVWDAMCRTIMSAGARRGAMMGTLRCDHPDIESFVAAKSDATRLRNFNVSVLVTDALVAAVRADGAWPLTFAGKVYRTVGARDLWQRIMRATYDYAEPGVIFIDRVNALNNLNYCETITATNPCGEQPLPAYGACLLGSINLARLVREPFTPAARLDEDRLAEIVPIAVRFLDDVIDVSGYPLAAQQAEAAAKRRIGLGLTGLADALAMCGARYDSAEARALATRWMGLIERHATLASTGIAREKGSFPLYDAGRFLASPGIARLDEDVRAAIAAGGIRNGLLTSIAPTGTISLFAGNVSSGIEPIFDVTARRRILARDGSTREEEVEDYAHRLFRKLHGASARLPEAFARATEIAPHAHLAMQAAVQRHVDSSISKTINCPREIAFDEFQSIYLDAFDLGLKGCTTFRPNTVTGSVLAPSSSQKGSRPKDGSPQTRPLASDAATTPDGPHPSGDVVYMAKPLERDPVLEGFTYKLRWPDSDHAIYITVNDTSKDGRRRPFEIFINSKNLEHYAWTVALTRMISAVFRRGGDVAFVVEELKAVFDPRGGQWMEGHYVPSLLAAIGGIIETHMIRIGFLPQPATMAPEPSRPALRAVAGDPRPRHCPRCSSPTYVRSEGCWSCSTCGFSTCT